MVEFCGGGDVVGGQWLQPDGEERCDGSVCCRTGVEAGSPAVGRSAAPLEPLPLTPSTSATSTSLGGAEEANPTAPGAAATAAQPGVTGQPNPAAQPSGGTPNFLSGFLNKVTGGSGTASPPATPPGNPNNIVPAGGTPVQLPSGNTPPVNLPRGNFPPGAAPPGFVPGAGVPPGGRTIAINGRRVTVDANGRPLPGSSDIPGSPATPAAAAANGGKAKIVTGSGKDLEKATTGVGAQGRGYGLGMVTTPVASYFAAQQSIVFKIQIPSGMNTFKAYNNRFPKSAEEFQKEILDPANITLPELPAGEYYNYDPATGELGVVHPSKNGESSGTNSGADDLAALQGTWIQTHEAREGGPMSIVLNGFESKLTINGNRFVMSGPTGGTVDVTFKLDQSKPQKEIDLSHGDKTVKGIYQLKDRQFTVCLQYNLQSDRPKSFGTTAGDGLITDIFQKQ